MKLQMMARVGDSNGIVADAGLGAGHPAAGGSVSGATRYGGASKGGSGRKSRQADPPGPRHRPNPPKQNSHECEMSIFKCKRCSRSSRGRWSSISNSFYSVGRLALLLVQSAEYHRASTAESLQERTDSDGNVEGVAGNAGGPGLTASGILNQSISSNSASGSSARSYKSSMSTKTTINPLNMSMENFNESFKSKSTAITALTY